MRLLFLLLVTAGATAELLDGVYNLDEAFEPMVAFACGRPSLYMTEEGWKTDRTQNCLSKPDEIMAYCSLKYPNSNISNFIPAATETNVEWESLTGSSTENISVRPYRCITKEFSSDALLVPDACQFGHIENSLDTGVAQCSSYDEWNATAHQHCADEHSMLYSFSVIVPCSVGKFSGVEYVCCPSANSTSQIDGFFEAMPKALADTGASVVDSAEQTVTEYDYVGEEGESLGGEYVTDSNNYEQDPDFINYDPSINYYVQYMETPENLGKNEHEAYTKAMMFTKRYYADERKSLDQQMNELNARYKNLTAKNVTMAKAMHTQQEQILKSLIKKVKETWESIRSAMNNEHERRVIASLENRRLDRIENFLNALGDAAEYDDLEAVKPLVQALKQYISSEEKERIHWINRYERMLDTNPDEAERIKMTVREMLLQIQQRIASVTQSLKRVPRIRSTVRSLLQEFLDDFSDVDQEVKFLFPDLDLAADVEKLMPPVQQLTTPADDLIVTGLESDYWVTANWFNKHNLVGAWSNRTIMICICTSVTSAVIFTIILIICCSRKYRNSPLPKRKSNLRPSQNIYHVPAVAVPVDVSKDSFDYLSRGILRLPTTDDANLRKMQMRGYENPMEGGSLILHDSETAKLVDNDANEMQNSLSKRN